MTRPNSVAAGRSAPLLARLEVKASRGLSPEVLALSPDFMDWQWLDGIFGRLPETFREPIADRYQKTYADAGQFAANTWLRDEIADVVTRDSHALAASDAELCAYAARRAEAVGAWLNRQTTTDADQMRAALAAYAGAAGVTLDPKWTLRATVARLTDPGFWRRHVRNTVGREVEGHAIKLGLVHRYAGLYASDETVQRHAQQKARNRKALEATIAENSEGEEFILADLADLGVSNPTVRFAELMVRVRGMEKHAREHGHAGLFVTGTCPSDMHARHSGDGSENDLFGGNLPKASQGWLARQWARIRAALARLGIRYYGVRVTEPHHDATPHWHMLVFIVKEMPGLTVRSAVARFKAVFRRHLMRGDWKPVERKQVVANLRQNGLTIKRANEAAGWVLTDARIRQRQAEKADAARVKYGVQFVDMDGRSPAGYLVKYLSKNIEGTRRDGESIGEVIDTGADGQQKAVAASAKSAAPRVLAWASCWRIRQFQVFGVPEIGIWRELRRLKEAPEQLELFPAWEATGSKEQGRAPDFGQFIEAQGGVCIPRADRPIQPWKLEEPGRLTKYLEEAPARVAGVVCQGVATATRSTIWTIRRLGHVGEEKGGYHAGSGGIEGAGTDSGRSRGRADVRGGVVASDDRRRPAVGGRSGVFQGQLRGMAGRGGGVGFDFGRRQAAGSSPWTRVNNCTERTKKLPGCAGVAWDGIAVNLAAVMKLDAAPPPKGFVGPMPAGKVFYRDMMDEVRFLKGAMSPREAAEHQWRAGIGLKPYWIGP